MLRTVLRGAAVSAFVILVACGTSEDPGLVGTPPANGSPVTAPPVVHTIEVTVTDGKPVGGVKREDVDLGEDVKLVVSSDVSDEIHVHGYNTSIEVEPGDEAVLEFNANIPGVFIVELEERSEPILEIEVK